MGVVLCLIDVTKKILVCTAEHLSSWYAACQRTILLPHVPETFISSWPTLVVSQANSLNAKNSEKVQTN